MHNLNQSASSNISVWALLHSYLWSCKQIHKIINAPVNEALNRWVHWLAHCGMSKERNMTPQARSRVHTPTRTSGRVSRVVLRGAPPASSTVSESSGSVLQDRLCHEKQRNRDGATMLQNTSEPEVSSAENIRVCVDYHGARTQVLRFFHSRPWSGRQASSAKVWLRNNPRTLSWV